jgi:light-regulated signal transduction histidine kinase (bacteriophytochrome)
VDIDGLIAETTRFIVERIYPDVFGFVLLDEDSGDFMPHRSYHGLPPGGHETKVPLEDSITGHVVRTGRPIIVPDVREDPLYFSIVVETRSEIAVPLQSGVEQVVSAFTIQASRKKVALVHEVPDELPQVVLDKSELQQVLSNLITNAIAYTPSGGKVTVRAGTTEGKRGPMTWFQVVDNGPGIGEGEFPRLFDRFYRGQAAADNDAPGTGLGLSICKEILEKHGGKIEVDSGPGQGSEFTVWWPIAEEA